MKQKRWSGYVTKHSFALDLEEGVFTFDDPKKIAKSLKRSAEDSLRSSFPVCHEHAEFLHK